MATRSHRPFVKQPDTAVRQRPRRCGLRRGAWPARPSGPRQARYDAAPARAGLRHLGALSRADRKRRRQSVDHRDARDCRCAGHADRRIVADEARTLRCVCPDRRHARSDPAGRIARHRRSSSKSTLGKATSADRAQRIALVGLRGAGKSTLGARLAEKLDCPFIELDRMIEQEYGASLPMLIEMSGLATFRRYERACLERVDCRTPACGDRDRRRHRIQSRNLFAAAAPHAHGLGQRTA